VNILIVSSIHKSAIETLQPDHEVTVLLGASESELIEAISEQHVLVFRSGVQITTAVLRAARQLQLIIRAGSGMDNIDWKYAEQRNIPIVRIARPGARAVAEMSFALMLALSRQIFKADKDWRAGHWTKSSINGHLLEGKTLGIIGAGNIGSLTGQLGSAWGMKVIGCVENPDAKERKALAEVNIEVTSFENVLRRSDYLSVHVPLQESTRSLINDDALALVRRGAFLINLARGGVVDEHAVRRALLDGRLSGAALDVHQNEGEGKISPLADLDNVILTPHIGANAIDAQKEIARIAVDAISSFDFAITENASRDRYTEASIADSTTRLAQVTDN